MKKVMMALGLVVMIVGWIGCTHVENHYTRKNCEVVNYIEDCVTVVDKCGYKWELIADGLEIGDKIDVRMYTNNTDNNIYDDEIVGYKYSK